MRFIIYGVGAIGGTIAARLALSGHDVIGIARGQQLAAIAAGGLLLRTPERNETARFPVHGDPTDIAFATDDVILLTMKAQDTAPALDRLRAAGVTSQAVFCFQNGVANERMALRRFPNVHGATVMMPATYVTPGEVAAFGIPKHGLFDLGRYPAGTDATVERLAAALDRAGFAATVRADVMASKYRKLLSNLRNIIDAAVGDADVQQKWYTRARAEGAAALAAAGIACDPEGSDGAQRGQMESEKIPGVERVGSSSLQSLVRAAGSIETYYLNGEIALLGRLHGVPVPVNAACCRMSDLLVAGDWQPRQASDADVQALVEPAGG